MTTTNWVEDAFRQGLEFGEELKRQTLENYEDFPNFLSNVQVTLNNPTSVPFDGEIAEAHQAIMRWLDTNHWTVSSEYLNYRLFAFMLTRAGVSYQEMGIEVPLRPVLVYEHTMLGSWINNGIRRSKSRRK